MRRPGKFAHPHGSGVTSDTMQSKNTVTKCCTPHELGFLGGGLVSRDVNLEDELKQSAIRDDRPRLRASRVIVPSC